MKVEVKHGDLVGVCEGSNAKEVFEQIAIFQETFEDKQCRLCSGNSLQYVVREVDGNKFYELRCKGLTKDNKPCGGKLTYGTEKETQKIYPRRYETEKEGKMKGKAKKDPVTGKAIVLGKWGWTRYNAETGKEE